MLKLAFHLEDSWGGVETENMWVELTDDKKLKIMNSPFYVTGVSYLDKVDYFVEEDRLFFLKVLEKSGHSTYRILLPKKKNIDKFELYWKPIEKLGCTYESNMNVNALYSVDVPPEVDIKKVYSFLEIGERDEIWGFEEADYSRV